jgi:hypothetical protein
MPSTPDTLSLQLSFPGLPELAPLVHDFARHALHLAGIEGDRHQDLLEALRSSLSLIEETLAREGDPMVAMELHATIDADAVEFRILEHGRPLGGNDAAGEGQPGGEIAAKVRPAAVFDRLTWVQRGTEGSELQLRAHRSSGRIEVLEAARHRLEASPQAEHTDLDRSGQTGSYRIRDYRTDDGLEIARRIYESYGRSYANPDLYMPDRIERLNREGRLHSIVCESPDGEIVGHYALERPDLGPTGEAGQAVIDHRHRGHGLMRPMREAVEQAGRALGLIGIWSQPTAMHPLSQRMNLSFGSCPSAVQLGLLPAGTALRGGVAGEAEGHLEGGRRSTFLYWHPLVEEPPIAAHAPDGLLDLLSTLYASRRREARFNADATPPHAGRGKSLDCRVSAALGTAWIAAARIDGGTADAIRSAADAIASMGTTGAIFADLPLDDPGAPAVAESLLADGWSVAGIAPRSIPRDDARRAEDALRFSRHPAAVDLPGLVAEGEIGRRLVEVATAAGTPRP